MNIKSYEPKPIVSISDSRDIALQVFANIKKANQMIKWIVNFFGIKKEKINFKQLINDGAIIIDVRSAQEFQGGHVKQSKNIPLNELNIKYKSLKKNKTIITCCASGMRSGSAVNFLKSQGFEKVYNGGGWMHLNGKVKG